VFAKKDNLCDNQEKREGMIMTGKGGEMEEEMTCKQCKNSCPLPLL